MWTANLILQTIQCIHTSSPPTSAPLNYSITSYDGHQAKSQSTDFVFPYELKDWLDWLVIMPLIYRSSCLCHHPISASLIPACIPLCSFRCGIMTALFSKHQETLTVGGFSLRYYGICLIHLLTWNSPQRIGCAHYTFHAIVSCNPTHMSIKCFKLRVHICRLGAV